MAETAGHRAPEPPSIQEGRPAVVCAFPRQTALALPLSEAAVGREWLEAAGLADTEVSTRHVRFARAGRSFRVADAGSRNGTWVDGTALGAGEDVALTDGALVRIGRTLLVYREALRGPLEPDPPLGGMVGPYGLRDFRAGLAAIARQRPQNVLIEGETGAGKELAAHAVAAALERGTRLVAVNVAGVAAGVFEVQLFGRVAGAYSDARTPSKGVIAQHEGGAVLLDEVGELPLDLQPKLLRLLDNREILPVGATQPVRVDVLLIAATNRDLESLVAAGTFRRDLHARLAMARLVLPPLRDRPEDLFAVAQALAARERLPLTSDATEVEAVERMLLYPWPSNTRELAAVLRRANALDPETRGLKLWTVEQVLGPTGPTGASGPGGPNSPRALSQQLVTATLEECGGSEAAAARRLGVSRGKLRRFLGKG
ncbi:MAG: sigma 54-interacting transcriptional regulator [Polyangiaceae bacterium]|nr:sigma 54-interacting transcriptional regulator [Polyangiaceae bacterium]